MFVISLTDQPLVDTPGLQVLRVGPTFDPKWLDTTLIGEGPPTSMKGIANHFQMLANEVVSRYVLPVLINRARDVLADNGWAGCSPVDAYNILRPQVVAAEFCVAIETVGYMLPYLMQALRPTHLHAYWVVRNLKGTHVGYLPVSMHYSTD